MCSRTLLEGSVGEGGQCEVLKSCVSVTSFVQCLGYIFRAALVGEPFLT